MQPTNYDILQGTVQAGHGVASGQSASSPYPAGSIAMQAPFFRLLGLDLSDCHLGTLNVAVNALAWRIVQPTHKFERVQWTHLHPAETFSFVRCTVSAVPTSGANEHTSVLDGHTSVLDEHTSVLGWLYYPHPETKAVHFQASSVMEIVAPRLIGVGYGAQLTLGFAKGTLAIERQ